MSVRSLVIFAAGSRYSRSFTTRAEAADTPPPSTQIAASRNASPINRRIFKSANPCLMCTPLRAPRGDAGTDPRYLAWRCQAPTESTDVPRIRLRYGLAVTVRAVSVLRVVDHRRVGVGTAGNDRVEVAGVGG